jgi:hypothetical protein
MMRIDDFVMLGRTVPESSKRHGLVVCSAGYSRELNQFIRIYPVAKNNQINRWSTCEIEVDRNNQDSRIESWKVKDGCAPRITGRTNKDFEFDFLDKIASPSIQALNEERKSLGIIRPRSCYGHFAGMKKNQERLFPLFDFQDNSNSGAKIPRLNFFDAHGEHDLQLRDWGSREFLRKHQEEKHYQLWDALFLNNPDYKHLFFVGNHNNHRNIWLVISVIFKKKDTQVMFDFAA